MVKKRWNFFLKHPVVTYSKKKLLKTYKIACFQQKLIYICGNNENSTRYLEIAPFRAA